MFFLSSLVVIGTGSGSLFAQTANRSVQSDTSGMEKYVKKVIVNAKWGKGPGEFQILKGGSLGGMVLDNKGNIYIPQLDFKSCVLKRFDKVGQYLGETPGLGYGHYGIDDEGNVYEANTVSSAKTKDSLGMKLVNKYSSQGSYLMSYRIYADLGMEPHVELSMFPKIKKGEIILEGDGREVAIGTTGRAYNGTMQVIRKNRRYEKRGVIKDNGRCWLEVLRVDDKKLLKINVPERVCSSLRGEDEDLFFEVTNQLDKWGNGFLLIMLPGKKLDSPIFEGSEFWKFSPQGKLLARIPVGSGSLDSLYLWGSTQIHLFDEEGNYYELRAEEQGVQVIKYEKVK